MRLVILLLWTTLLDRVPIDPSRDKIRCVGIYVLEISRFLKAPVQMRMTLSQTSFRSLFSVNLAALRCTCCSFALYSCPLRQQTFSTTSITHHPLFYGYSSGKRWRNDRKRVWKGLVNSTRQCGEPEPCCRNIRICLQGNELFLNQIGMKPTDDDICFVRSTDHRLGANRRCWREARCKARQ